MGRISDSVDVLYSLLYQEKEHDLVVDTALVIKVLIITSFVVSEEKISSTNLYQILELIHKVQNDDKISIQDKMNIEWMCLSILDGLQGRRPVILEAQLSRDPKLFCDMIKRIYGSDKEEEKEISKEQASVAHHAYKLLDRWEIPPGTDDVGGFDAKKFKEWLRTVRENAKETGHLDSAMYSAGKVLIKIPKDDDGFWIDKEVAAILNDEDSDKLREGLFSGYVNSTGVYTGGVEFENSMANKFREMAVATEKLGYRRLANCIWNLEKFWLKDCRDSHDAGVENEGEE